MEEIIVTLIIVVGLPLALGLSTMILHHLTNRGRDKNP